MLITYFVSRLLRRLGLRPPSAARLAIAHSLSLGLISAGVALLRLPADVFDFTQL